MKKQFSSGDKVLWQRYVEAHAWYQLSTWEFYSNCKSKVELVRFGLETLEQRYAALEIAAVLPMEERQQLLDALLALAIFSHGSTVYARDIILSMPHEWLLANIEMSAEPLLQNDDYEEYRGLFEIYVRIDRNLSLRLAHRAFAHSDVDIREAGEDFLKELVV